MLRLKKQIHDVKDEKLALPGAQPLTLIQVSSDNLPYGCQCPLCGGIFEIPQGILYKLQEDGIADVDSGAEAKGPGDTDDVFFEDANNAPTNEPEGSSNTETVTSPAEEA